MTFGEQPAYLRVASDLREKIVNGSLPPHTRLPSQARIREEYGVSDTVALEPQGADGRGARRGPFRFRHIRA